MKELTETLSPGQIAAILFGVAMAVSGAIVTFGNAIEKLVKLWRAAKAPDDRQNDRLTALEDWRKEVDDKLTKDHDRFESLDNGNRVTQRALLALLDHGIDGNNIEQMQHAKEELQNHLINR